MSTRWLVCLTAAWLLVAAASLAGVWRYKTTAGPSAEAPSSWPEASRLARAPGRATVVMLAHPRCPCTRASVRELEQLMTRVGRLATAHVLFVSAADGSSGSEKGELFARAQAIPGVSVSEDPGGARAALFGAGVSGHTLVYDADGRLLFSGGITAARGHEGDNRGRAQIVSLLTGTRHGASSSEVYGCELASTAAERRSIR